MRCRKALGIGAIDEAYGRLPPGDTQYLLHSEDARKKDTFDVDDFVAQHMGRMVVPRSAIRTKTVSGHDVVKCILEESVHYDLVVLGCTREPLIYQVARDSVPETVARVCTRPLVMVKAPEGIKSWFKRWI